MKNIHTAENFIVSPKTSLYTIQTLNTILKSSTTQTLNGDCMNLNEKKIIDDLFAKLLTIDHSEQKWDPQANQQIQSYIRAYPWLVYYMTQILLIQEQALLETQRHQSLTKAQNPLTGIFQSQGLSPQKTSGSVPAVYPEQTAQPSSGRGFLQSALQTALGVAGGMVLGNAFIQSFQDSQTIQDTPADDQITFDPGDDGFEI